MFLENTCHSNNNSVQSNRILGVRKIAYFIVFILLSGLLFNCSSNRMGLFDCFRKKSKTVTISQKSQDSFTIFSIEDNSLPAVGLVNNQLVSNADWASFPWNCSVVVRCKDVNAAGLPTDAEASVLNCFEDSLNARIVADKSVPNALFFGRVNWNSTRELIWKVKNPEPVAAFLQSVIDDKDAIREIDFKMEYDKEWEMTRMYSDGISKKEHGIDYTLFERWLDKSLDVKIPKDVVAFCFNIYDDGDNNWNLELVGASSFDKENSDWACDEAFTTRDNPFRWHEEADWKQILTETELVVKVYLEQGRYGKLLKEYKAVAVGFVDGDLVVLWP